MGGGINEKHQTMLEKKLSGEMRRRRNGELHVEREMFLSRLKLERDTRAHIESVACIEIQRTTRGFLRRPRTNYVRSLKESREATKFLMNAKARLTSDLLEMTEAVGLPPIPGMTLDSRKMMEEQKREEELKRLEVSSLPLSVRESSRLVQMSQFVFFRKSS